MHILQFTDILIEKGPEAVIIKTAIITGASRGIGEGIAKAFVCDGYNVCTLSRTEPTHTYGEFYICDVSDYTAVERTVKKILLKYKHIDILVNNAGISHTSLVQDMTDAQYNSVMDINLKGVFNTVKAVSPSMINQKHGKIINISSIWGITGASCEAVYSASKAAVIGFTKALCKELGPSGICVNAVCPGVIRTSMLDIYTEDELNALAEETPLLRLGTVSDVANLVSFLASDKADFITGQAICTDGGISV